MFGKPSTLPRYGHYAFAHGILPSAAFQDPSQCLTLLASPDARPFLSHLLKLVSKHCKAVGEPKPDFGVDDLTVHKVRVGPYPSVVVEMPAPRIITEAFFTALVLLDANQGNQIPEAEGPQLRCFTLEKGAPERKAPGTVLGEWTVDGSHYNYGDGPAPELNSFVQALASKL